MLPAGALAIQRTTVGEQYRSTRRNCGVGELTVQAGRRLEVNRADRAVRLTRIVVVLARCVRSASCIQPREPRMSARCSVVGLRRRDDFVSARFCGRYRCDRDRCFSSTAGSTNTSVGCVSPPPPMTRPRRPFTARRQHTVGELPRYSRLCRRLRRPPTFGGRADTVFPASPVPSRSRLPEA